MPFGANHFFVHCKDYDIAKRVSIEKKTASSHHQQSSCIFAKRKKMTTKKE
jgi:hypothetical protein